MALTLTDSLNLEPDDPYMDPYGWKPERCFCGLAWPVKCGFTIVGLMRIRNVAHLLLAVMSNSVDGDYVEAGVWRGGTGIRNGRNEHFQSFQIRQIRPFLTMLSIQVSNITDG